MGTNNLNPKAAASSPELELPQELQAFYANLVRISHSPAEIVFDFAQSLSGQTQIKVQSRLVMSPIGAKLFFHALGENLARYEAAYGEITVPGDLNLVSELFRPPQNPPNSNPKTDPPPQT
jgi:hypothetical protein